LDIRQVFPRISEIAATVLPHDRLTLSFHDQQGEVVVQAASDEWAPLPARLKVGDPGPEGDASQIIDLESYIWPVIEPPGCGEQVGLAGGRSMRVVRLSARDQRLGLQFWSKRRGAFDERQVAIARRIADHVALAVSHEQLAEVAREAAEAKLRADRLEAR